MSWTQVSSSRWERPVDGLEGYFVAMAAISADLADGREHYTLFTKIKLETELPNLESALRHAWKQLRYVQPQIAITAQDMKMVYEVPDETCLEKWLASTFVVSPASDAEELYEAVAPIKQATLYYLPNSSELMLRCHHHSIDGTGLLLFWDAYLGALSRPVEDIAFGDEPARLAPTMAKVLGFPDEAAPDVQKKVSQAFGEYAVNAPGIGPISQLGAASSLRPRNCRNVEVVFSADETGTLVDACRARGVSVTAAVHAAYVQALATRHADPASNLTKYVTVSLFNLRKYLPEPYGSSSYAMSVYYSPLPYTADLPASYWDIARPLHRHYQTSFKDNVPEALKMRGPLGDAMLGAVRTPGFLDIPPSKDAMVSSLGVVEGHVRREYGGGSLRVRDVKVAVDITAGTSMLFVYTFDDRLRLVYNFNDGFEERGDVERYLETVKEILDAELIT
ncbi:hypothetical protein N3K66_006131 [Trichothecium roseum]|uniref:Uncharacterized protein n=1 Tax=Trichothecium roseum TaxID=47278 RepID=A0ACC0V1M3_9HYPO|nr:hypothetical protein N3K66_006131 [Trichothecium roseum]